MDHTHCRVKRQVSQQFLFEPVPVERLELQSKEDLIEFIKLQQKVNDSIIKENQRLRALNQELKEQVVLIEDQYVTFKSKFFGKSAEREPVADDDTEESSKSTKKVKVQLPSARYPDAPLIERDIELQILPACECCGATMKDSGMTEDSEYLTVIPQQYIIIRQKRHKYCNHFHEETLPRSCNPFQEKAWFLYCWKDEDIRSILQNK